MKSLSNFLYFTFLVLAATVIGSYCKNIIETVSTYVLLILIGASSLFCLYMQEKHEEKINAYFEKLQKVSFKTWLLYLLSILIWNLTFSFLSLLLLLSLTTTALFSYDLISYTLAMSFSLFIAFACLYVVIVSYFYSEIVEEYAFNLMSKVRSLFTSEEE